MDQIIQNSKNRQSKIKLYFSQNVELQKHETKQEDDISQWNETIRKIPSLNSKNKGSQVVISQQDSKAHNLSSERNMLYSKNQVQNSNQINEQVVNNDLHVSNSYIEETLNNFSPRSQTIFSSLQINKMKNQQYVINIKSSSDHQVNSPQLSDLKRFNFSSSSPLKASVINKIKIYIYQFYKKYTVSGKTLLLNSRIRKLISDNSDYFNSPIKPKKYPKSFFQNNFIKYMNCFQNLPLLDSQTNLGITIKAAFTFMNCLSLYLLSLNYFYEAFQDSSESFYLFLRLFWITEIIFHLNSIPYLFYELKMNRMSIFYQYVKQRMIYDVLPLVLVDFSQIDLIQNIIVYFLVFLKAINANKDIKILQKIIQYKYQQNYLKIQLISLIFQMFYIGHSISCFWFSLNRIQKRYYNIEKTWFDSIQDKNIDWQHNYVWSLYWAFSLITTVSDNATNIYEAIFTVIALMFIIFFFGYYLYIIKILLTTIYRNQQQKIKETCIISQFMISKNISKKLQGRVINDLERSYEKNYKQELEEKDKILERLSIDLQNSLQIEQNLQILNKIEFLTNNFSQNLIGQLALCFQEEVYSPNQIISSKESSAISLVYIISGKVQVVESMDQQFLNKNNSLSAESQLFGQLNFFTGEPQTYHLKASSFCQAIKLERNQFLNILKNNSKDQEIFNCIKDKLLFNQDFRSLKLFCSCCNSQSHILKDCQYVHFNTQQAQLKSKLIQNSTCQRVKKERKPGKKLKALFISKFLKQISFQIRKAQSKFYEIGNEGSNQIDSDRQSQSSIEYQENSPSEFELLHPRDSFSIQKTIQTETIKKSLDQQETEQYSVKTKSLYIQDNCTVGEQSQNQLKPSLFNETEQNTETLKHLQKGSNENIMIHSKNQTGQDSQRLNSELTKSILKESQENSNPLIYSDINNNFDQYENDLAYQKLLNNIFIKKPNIKRNNSNAKSAFQEAYKFENPFSSLRVFQQNTEQFIEDDNQIDYKNKINQINLIKSNNSNQNIDFIPVMEENQLKLHQKQKQQLKNQNQLCDIKLSVLNKLDESSCWSDSQRMRLTQSFSSFIDEKQQQNYDDSNLNCKQQEIRIQNKTVNWIDKSEQEQNQYQNIFNCSKTQNNIIQISNSDLNHVKSECFVDKFSQIKKQSVENKSSQCYESKEKSQSFQKSTLVRVRADQSAKRKEQGRRNSIVNLKLLTKIKYKISYFYQKYTLSGRTSLLNEVIRAHIDDLSDDQCQIQIQYLQQLIVNYLPILEKLLGKCSLPIITNYSLKQRQDQLFLCGQSQEIHTKILYKITVFFRHNSNNYKTLQQQVNFSLQNYYRKNYQKISEENYKILGKISLDLQKSVLREQNIQILNKISCLKNNFSLKSIEELSLKVKEEYYLPNQVIVNSDEQQDGSMFYIISGQIELIGSFYKEQCLQTPLSKVKKGELIGQLNFFTGLQQTPCIRSSGFTKVLRIQRDNFIEIIKSNQLDFEIFCQINDKIKLSIDFSDVIQNYNCSICRKQNHYQLQCPLISLDRESFLFKTTSSYNQKQKRLKFRRKKERKINSLNNMKETQKSVKVLINKFKIQNQSAPTCQKLDAQFFSDEDDEFIKSQINQSLTNESQDFSKNNSQEENCFSKCKYDQIQAQLDSSIKIHKYSSSQKNQQSSNDLEEHSIVQVSDYQKSQFNSLRSEIQHSVDINSSESQRSIKRQQEILRINSRDMQQGTNEGEFQRKKSYMRNYLKKSSSLRTNFYGQLSQIEESKILLNENHSLIPTIKKSNSKINKQESAIEHQVYSNLNNSKLQNNIFDFDFEKMQNFKFYYSQGNSKLQIFRYNRYIKKKIRNSKKNKKNI
ncbi:hypothetical protein ABPG73_021460 [Tetrahymena malaccensis]